MAEGMIAVQETVPILTLQTLLDWLCASTDHTALHSIGQRNNPSAPAECTAHTLLSFTLQIGKISGDVCNGGELPVVR